MLIDTHAHVNFAAYRNDADEVIRRSLDTDTWIVNVGSQYSTSRRAIDFSQKYKEEVYAAVGLHPIYAEEGFDYEKYKQLTRSSAVVAIGETGLDYKEEYISFKEKQKEVFLKQIELAQELRLPIIFHCRMAYEDLLETLKGHLYINKYTPDELLIKGVIHCFAGNWKQAQKFLEMGFYLGFNGIIFKMNLNDVIKKTPLDKILIETDCPYLTPPSAGTERNEPIYVRYVAEKIAQIKNITLEEIAQLTTENAKRLFKI